MLPWSRILQLLAAVVLWVVLPWFLQAIHRALDSEPGELVPEHFEDLANFRDALHEGTEPLWQLLATQSSVYAIWTAVVYAQLALLSLWAIREHWKGRDPTLAPQLMFLLVFGTLTNLVANLPPSRYRLQPEPVGVQLWFAVCIERVDSYVAPRLAWWFVVSRRALSEFRKARLASYVQIVLYVLSTRLIYTTGLINTLLLVWVLGKSSWVQRHYEVSDIEPFTINDERATNTTQEEEEEEDDDEVTRAPQQPEAVFDVPLHTTQ